MATDPCPMVRRTAFPRRGSVTRPGVTGGEKPQSSSTLPPSLDQVSL